MSLSVPLWWLQAVQSAESTVFYNTKIVDWAHFLVIACMFKDAGARQTPLLQRLVGLVLNTFGGSMMACILLGQPAAFLLYQTNFVNFLFVHFLVMYAPLVHRVLKFKPIWGPLMLTATFNPIFAIVGGVTRGLTSAHSLNGSFVAVVLCAWISGVGGGILSSAFNLPSGEWKFQSPVPLRASFPFGVYPQFFCALFFSCVRVCQPNTPTEFAAYCASAYNFVSLTDAQAIIAAVMVFFKAVDVFKYMTAQSSTSKSVPAVDAPKKETVKESAPAQPSVKPVDEQKPQNKNTKNSKKNK
jgi:hypothetical protein